MRFSSIIFLAVYFFCSSGSDNGKVALPKEWTKDFVITASNGGGMIDQSVKTTFTFDSVVFERRVESKKIRKCIRLNASKRNEILKKLKELKIEEVRVRSTSPTMDASNTDLCFASGQSTTCLSQGYATEIHPDDTAKFADSYAYLIAYADPEKH